MYISILPYVYMYLYIYIYLNLYVHRSLTYFLMYTSAYVHILYINVYFLEGEKQTNKSFTLLNSPHISQIILSPSRTVHVNCLVSV